ncbi:hypothetical protein [Pseudomonas mandelii]|uniref:Uncharacterized protein n=1 Tax=Pseudomonas mandelii TaxID=75612 RepID=A0A502HGM0_9PSED|nr:MULTISPECIES: hypothetical protein [Pseudomonas]TPG72824.1 hypothetical protein EAH74_32925 [Pseudomonas mandelii]TPG88930.1 hypothetical protein EAH72_32480 [Pseudomonas caspiana]
MDKLIFQLSDMEIWARGDRFFVRYDAGSHQIVMREDEISEQDVQEALLSNESAMKMLFALQKRLIQAGIDPYVSNTKD